jgi:hypothetical protein
MPAFHLGMLGTADEDRAVLNLGGIANLTLIPREGAVRGFDTGPANALMDAWCQRHTGRTFDADGAYAASGAVDEPAGRLAFGPVVRAAAAEEHRARTVPPGLGRGAHGRRRVRRRRCAGHPAGADRGDGGRCAAGAAAADPAPAGLWRRRAQPAADEAAGGAAAGVQVESSAVHGLDPEYVEAMGFAWLAQRTMDGLAGNLPSVTGAGPRILGRSTWREVAIPQSDRSAPRGRSSRAWLGATSANRSPALRAGPAGRRWRRRGVHFGIAEAGADLQFTAEQALLQQGGAGLFVGPAAGDRDTSDAFQQQRVQVPQHNVGHAHFPVRKAPPLGASGAMIPQTGRAGNQATGGGPRSAIRGHSHASSSRVGTTVTELRMKNVL